MERISIYTDGSCNPIQRIGAWASFIFHGQERKTLTGHAYDTTHHRMELDAVIHALDYLKAHSLLHHPVFLFTDSQYVSGLEARKERLTASRFQTKKKNTLPNADLLWKIFGCFNELSVTVIKVKSHQKNTPEERLNSEVDKLCRNIVRDLIKKN